MYPVAHLGADSSSLIDSLCVKCNFDGRLIIIDSIQGRVDVKESILTIATCITRLVSHKGKLPVCCIDA